jgi:hypothetical protein
MRTSLNDIRQIEHYLDGKDDQGESTLLKSRLLNEPGLFQHLKLQRLIMRLVKLYHFKKLKLEAQQAGAKIFSNPDMKDFQQNIYQLFNK